MSTHKTAFGYVADADALTIADALAVQFRGYRVIGEHHSARAPFACSAPCDSPDADAARAKRAGARVWRHSSGELRTDDIREHTGGHIPHGAREVFSWGSHFTLSRFIPRGTRGNRRALFVLNGDVWGGSSGFSSSTTDYHQRTARRICEELGAPFVVIPFQALAGADLDLDSIRLVDSRPETDWTETRETREFAEVPHWARRVDGRERERDADGFYRWTVSLHRLGEALFSATRRESWRELPDAGADCRVALTDADRAANADADLCDANPYAGESARHIADATGRACVFCGRQTSPELRTRDRRARYLSGFDTNETPPQYFLAEVPRGAGDTVSSAFDALAPRAVHAAIARGLVPRRQGDVFFIPTEYADADLEARGIVSRARLTQWTRDAKARPGEVGFIAAPSREALKRRHNWARRYWRETMQAQAARELCGRERSRPDRATRRESWRALFAARDAIGAARELSDAGERLSYSALRDADAGERLRHRASVVLADTARTLDARERELNGWRGELTPGDRSGRPNSDPGARRRFAKLRAAHAQALEDAARELRAAILGPAGARHYSRGYRDSDTNARLVRDARGNSYARAGTNRYSASGIVADRAAHAKRIADARRELDALRAKGAQDSHGFRSRAHARDTYRTRWTRTPIARTLWTGAKTESARRFAPATLSGAPEWTARRERIRAALSIYGTSHAASEVIRVRGGAVYARGTVRHIPELARGGAPEHRPTPLGDGSRWYLAVRNTVPRARDNRAPRRARRATDSR
jgi:hypothetical protein